jgi:hypothetical protein
MTGPPSSQTTKTGTRVILPTDKSTVVSSDPNLLLDAFDTYTAGNRRNSNININSNTNTKNNANSTSTSTSSSPDPIDFLNEHYTSEALLVAQLPLIRDAVSERMNRLDDRISGALQRQSESADSTQQHVQDAKASVASLEQRIRQVQQKASQSETTVREITKDMKRLDCAKRHLQRTITTLKRLHMLIHAVEQLRLACLLKPFPEYKTASHLVDAIRLLLKHFDAYQHKVEPMRLLSTKVTDLQGELKYCLIRGFRIVGFGLEATMELEREKKNKYTSIALPLPPAEEGGEPQTPAPTILMSPQVMADGILLVDALGKEARDEFITVFGQDQLAEYSRIFKPVRKLQPKQQQRVSSFKAQPEAPKDDTKPEFALEFIEKRFLWFRNMLNQLGDKYPGVFPIYWNIEYLLTKTFLKRVSPVNRKRSVKHTTVPRIPTRLSLSALYFMFSDADSYFGTLEWTHQRPGCQQCDHPSQSSSKNNPVRKGSVRCAPKRVWMHIYRSVQCRKQIAIAFQE